MLSKSNFECSNCKRKIGELEEIAIVANVSELNGMTHIGRFAKAHTILCLDCLNSKKNNS